MEKVVKSREGVGFAQVVENVEKINLKKCPICPMQYDIIVLLSRDSGVGHPVCAVCVCGKKAWTVTVRAFRVSGQRLGRIEVSVLQPT